MLSHKKTKFIPQPYNVAKKVGLGLSTAIIISLILHSSLMLALVVADKLHPHGSARLGHGQQQGQKSGQAGKSPKPNDEVEVTIIPKPAPGALAADEEVSKDGIRYKIHKTTEGKCEAWYGGIGVSFMYIWADSYFIEEVGKGYPADKAGLQPGDQIVGLNQTGEIRGEPGTKITIHVLKRGQATPIEMELTRDKICTQPPTRH